MRYLWLLGLIFNLSVFAQEHHPQNGVAESTPEYYAFKNARIILSPGEELSKGTILIKDNEIVDVGRFVAIPKGTVIMDCEGLTILPSFIELNSDLGMPKEERKPWSFRPQLESSKDGAYYWNESIHPEVAADQWYKINEKAIEEVQKMGFGLVLTHPNDGIAQGTGSLVSLSTQAHSSIYQAELGAFFSLDKGNSRQSYPSSQMGSIALLRQTFYDLDWYASGQAKKTDLSLKALQNQLNQPLFFHTEDKYEILRAQKIADEFGLKFTYFGTGNEYGIADALKTDNLQVVLPIHFPVAYDVSDPYVNREIPLADLKHWELAPHNARLLKEKGVPYCLSGAPNGSSTDFWTNIQRLLDSGISPDDVLAGLTTAPAELLNIGSEVGTIAKGKKAYFTIYDKHPLEEKAILLENWVMGERYVLSELPSVDIRGKYNLLIDGEAFPIDITGTAAKPIGKITFSEDSEDENATASTKIEVTDNNVVIQFNTEEGSVNLKGKFTERMGIFEGSGQLPNGEWVRWSGIKNTPFEEEKKKDEAVEPEPVGPSMFPNMAFGFETLPKKGSYLIQNATVWTNTDAGILNNASVAVKNGKVVAVGKSAGSAVPGATVIDGTNMHLTPGIIDEHSHIAISKGVNEGGQAVSAEVSIAHVVDAEDIDIYRQLSGGVTAAQLLHGSANPIGGQSALIKLKWGFTPDEMLIDSAAGFIKFALGENVKQSNWGMFNNVRFPQTRMGVEQVFHDGFNRALRYKQQKATGIYRVDLELETLLEILEQNRFISCHSYVQSEINMLMHVADSFGFYVNTFTHILEGYKVADKMAAHGAGGSTFSDWWAYKYEVRDAIPYNASLMQEQGVVVAINSDDAEMGRRLNQEAAKGIKYGGMTEEQALKMVTLNPAKLLHLDHRMGSIQPGMDADLVLWTAHPLSVTAKAQITMIDGQILFDRAQQSALLQRDAAERARILSLMLADNKKGAPKKKFKAKKKAHFHCDTMGEEATIHTNSH